MSKYALNLDTDGRILSVTYEEYATKSMPITDTLLDNNIADYKYINGEFIYDPLPEPIQSQEPTTEDIINALLGIKGE
uniref:Uncharacterized protein n=1 Tax=Siphoviridae sp. ctTBR23 TaxID=2825515 RepID=A0A8S5P0F6_9CAUD|nr:MAG TPA: hypothetical protein [Siphoviridae sp. ctTBR23]